MQNKRYTKSITILSILIILVIFVIYFLYRDIEIKNGKILNLNSELSLLNTRQDYLKNIETFFDNSKIEVSKIDASVIAKGGDIDFIEDIENIAKKYSLNVDIESLNLMGDSEKDKNKINYLRLSTKIRVYGSWTSVYKFSNELESLPFRIKINSATIDGRPGAVSPTGKKSPNIWTGVFDILVLENK